MSYLDPPETSKRLTGIVFVGLLHVFLIYALVTGLARKVVEIVIPPLETKVIEEVKPPPVDKPPPPPPPKLAAPPPPYIPPPEVKFDTPPPPATNAIAAVSAVKPAVEAPVPVPKAEAAPPAPPKRTPAVVDANACEKPEYPAASLRAQETGLVVLSFLIGPDGTVQDSKVQKSSGSRKLDEAARSALSLCKFKPATVDGKPEQAWARIEYEWKID